MGCFFYDTTIGYLSDKDIVAKLIMPCIFFQMPILIKDIFARSIKQFWQEKKSG